MHSLPSIILFDRITKPSAMGFSELKIDACVAFEMHHLDDLASKDIEVEATFWGIDPHKPQTWFGGSRDQKINKKFTELHEHFQHRIICNECLFYYGKRLLDYLEQYNNASTVEKARLQRTREQLEARNFEELTREEKRDFLADKGHSIPRKSIKSLFVSAKQRLEEMGKEWAAHCSAPKLTKAQNEHDTKVRDAEMMRGCIRTDMVPLMDWAAEELVDPRFEIGERGAAGGVDGGRRPVEYINPVHEMVKVDGFDNKIRMNFQAKTGQPPPTNDVDDDSTLADVSLEFYTTCTSADVYLKAREEAQSLYTWGIDAASDAKNVKHFCAAMSKAVKKIEVLQPVRVATVEKHGSFVPYDLRKMYVAYVIHQRQQSGHLPPGDEHRLNFIQMYLGHKNIESSKAYNRYSHVSTSEPDMDEVAVADVAVADVAVADVAVADVAVADVAVADVAVADVAVADVDEASMTDIDEASEADMDEPSEPDMDDVDEAAFVAAVTAAVDNVVKPVTLDDLQEAQALIAVDDVEVVTDDDINIAVLELKLAEKQLLLARLNQKRKRED
jgi:hypothetical protein